VNSGLGQKRCPANSIRSTNVGSGVISDHKKAQFLLLDFPAQLILDKLESLELRFSKVYMFKVKAVFLAVILENVVEWPESHSWAFVASCPNDIVLSSEKWR
jgi:hypothetical protein